LDVGYGEMIQEALDADFEAVLSGRAPTGLRLPDTPLAEPTILAMLRELANGIRPYFAPASWMIISDGEIVGLCSLVKPPTDGAIDIGYGIAESCRSKGHASRAVSDLLLWARGEERVKTCKAETSASNTSSQWVLETNGFVQTGARIDAEDGEMICWMVSVEA
jgi:RimJ/RimL family protein N-acetyltransferase